MNKLLGVLSVVLMLFIFAESAEAEPILLYKEDFSYTVVDGLNIADNWTVTLTHTNHGYTREPVWNGATIVDGALQFWFPPELDLNNDRGDIIGASLATPLDFSNNDHFIYKFSGYVVSGTDKLMLATGYLERHYMASGEEVEYTYSFTNYGNLTSFAPGFRLDWGGDIIRITSFEVYGIARAPIPGAVWLLGSGVAGLAVLKRRKAV